MRLIIAVLLHNTQHLVSTTVGVHLVCEVISLRSVGSIPLLFLQLLFAIMYQRLWSWMMYIFGLAMQALWQCHYDDKVSAGSLNKTQYSGKWHFIMVAADSEASLLRFGAMDSAVFLLTPMEAKEKLLLRGEFRLIQASSCLSRQWTYHISNVTQEMVLEGRPEQKTELFVKDGDNYIILLETQEEGLETFRRLMLYGRSPTLTDDLRLEFVHRASCLDMAAFLVLERAQAPCEIS
ncbi:apolipoprotein M [Heptranchias perlo]|uniref:apolipoprotein M n=1 Tax=Heptranchias perlo TaxID=212740 RepID=UPI00355A01EC